MNGAGEDGRRAGGGVADGRRSWLLAIDTATSRVVVAAAALDGTPLGVSTWEAGRTHGAQLLPAIGRLTGEANLRRARIRGVIVGTGPGAFTGLRVGIATAKALAHELAVPIVGVSTGAALLEASGAGERGVLLLPAGPNDRLVVRSGTAAVLLPGGSELDVDPGDILVAVDLDDRAPADAVARGEAARAGFPAAMVRLGAARLAAGDVDDLARLVPDYVSLPRGVERESGEVAWSRDRP
ncbi:MAG TPA: tRNA (adenosine(37)-N6)-threonylcarbamoyltransferase complex dimerization subunit type 1 TsaB [Candidatus Limnocylindrales bacterium]|nr:tRNA (adenosine(37)-N6)-threonylcarbamoyltransferase complex dimerization subunit type 1 TsaB [Candidatus Limnocylindrales bacterium]